ncbi:MAG: DNA repair protein RadC [Anaerolineales bacterium]|nr:DNA repair protein RadC [Chloroflexota bacterium]MBL6981203.1 DNA repair protein RadC [Anaerolineales bacterium]
MNKQFSYLQPSPRVNRLPLRERPSQRVALNPESCSLVELLAAIIGGPRQLEVAEALLDQFGDVRSLINAHHEELAGVRGIGTITAAKIKAALALSQRLLEPAMSRPTIQNPKDAADIVQPLIGHREQEYLLVVLLNTRNQVIEVAEIYRGSVNSSQVRIAEVFKPAIRRNAPAIILSHNHPSGDPTPSPDDVAVTRAIVEAGKLLDVQVLDHLVIGSSRWLSMKEHKMGFGS